MISKPAHAINAYPAPQRLNSNIKFPREPPQISLDLLVQLLRLDLVQFRKVFIQHHFLSTDYVDLAQDNCLGYLIFRHGLKVFSVCSRSFVPLDITICDIKTSYL